MHSEFAARQHQAAEFAGRSILGGVAAGQPVCREGWLILTNSKKIRPLVGKVALAENNADFWGCVCYIISARKGGPNGGWIIFLRCFAPGQAGYKMRAIAGNVPAELGEVRAGFHIRGVIAGIRCSFTLLTNKPERYIIPRRKDCKQSQYPVSRTVSWGKWLQMDASDWLQAASE